MRKAIVIIGTGTMLGRDFTARSEAELTKSDRILTIVREPVESWLPAPLRDRHVEQLHHLYTNHADRMDNYLRVANHVIEVADCGGTVAFVTYGSPLVYDRVVSLLRSLAVDKHISCRVLPGVSSIDAILTVLGEDVAPGLQICEARWMVVNQIALNPKLPVLLFQVGIFWTDGMTSVHEMAPSKLAPLKDFLLLHYHATHQAVFVRAPSFEGDAGYMRATELSRLDDGFADDLSNTSLYVPAISGYSDLPKFWNTNHDPGQFIDF